MYKDGDLCISSDKLIRLLDRVGSGKYTTFDLIEKYQGFAAINKGKEVHESWNASFGRILKQFSKDHPKTIREIETKVGLFLDARKTTASRWEVF